MTDHIKAAIFHKLPKVKGYMDVLDAFVFTQTAAAHEAMKAEGAVAEIGVFFGRSLFLLREIYGTDKILGMDLFDIPAEGGNLAQIDQILAYSDRFEFGVTRDMLLQADSTKLKPETILDAIGPVKFFSVDGGHMLHHVECDSLLADTVLTDEGVIAFDDSFNPEWPEVTAGIIDFLRSHPDYATFCISDKKLYVCRKKHHAHFKSHMESLTGAFGHAEREFLGHTALTLHHSVEKKIAARVLTKTGIGGLSAGLYNA
jgi:hypothetical protein